MLHIPRCVAVRMAPRRKISVPGFPVRRLDTAIETQNSGGSELVVGGDEVSDEADIDGALTPNTYSGGVNVTYRRNVVEFEDSL